MNEVVIALDLETTGLDPQTDEIIEIGAVKFRGEQVIEEWQSLVYPGRSIPAFVTRLTGLTDEDVAKAPRFSSMLPQLRKFIGTTPLLGHNVQFDLAVLSAAGFRTGNPVIDTYTLASVLLPDVPRYNLTALVNLLGVTVESAHRALDDALMTRGLYLKMYEQAMELPLNTLAEIVRHGSAISWDGAHFFKTVMQQRAKEVFVSPAPNTISEFADEMIVVLGGSDEKGHRLKRSADRENIDIDAVATMLEPEGLLDNSLPDYEHRPQQVEMLRSVARAFNDGWQVFVEAPTGVGKTLAYLIPAINYATLNGERVVISTNTINLQEQLVTKDIPNLQKVLPTEFRAAVLKGRSNYLCPRRLAALRRRGPTSAQEMHMLAKLLVWLTRNSTGDRGHITLRGSYEVGIWRRLSADDEGCTLARCAEQMDGACPYYKARRAAEDAHLIIVNHALLLSDVATDGHVLPEFRNLIVDEAHHLEDAVTNSLGFRTEADAISRQIAELGNANSGLLGELLRQTQGSIPPGYYDSLVDYVDMVSRAADAMGNHVDWFFKSLEQFLEANVRIPRNEYTQQIRIVQALRAQTSWSNVETHWDNLSKFTATIAEAMLRLVEGLAQLEEFDIEDFGDLIAGVRAAARHMVTLHERLDELVLNPDDNMIYWAEFRPGGGRFSIHAAPLDVGPLVQEHIWFEKETVVMTSATLRTNNSFNYLKERLDATDVKEVAIDSPFDYENNTLLYVVDDIPEPSDRFGFQKAVEKGVLDLCLATNGRAMILFTSYAQLQTTARAIGDDLAQAGIELFDQSEGVSRLHMLEGFVESDKAVLMGTRSFWEGVDVPGTDLSVLVIIRLPFNVPSDPLFAARSELFENPFNEYAVPETILKFRQGFGRLIRRKDDYGIVAIFDRRVLSKPYGRLFLHSLPQCRVQQGRLSELPDVAVHWLNRE